MDNLCNFCSTAKDVEDIVRSEGVIPATVGILKGKVHVGLSSDELEFLARTESAHKVSRRDLPYVISKVRTSLNPFHISQLFNMDYLRTLLNQ